MLDPFWDEKGYVTAEEYRRFCNATVPLARMAKMSFTNAEDFAAEIEVAHFGPAPLRGVIPAWAILDGAGKTAWEGTLPKADVPIDNAVSLGRIEVPLGDVAQAEKFVLRVTTAGFTNSWDFWVYPAKPAEIAPGNVLIVRSLDDGAWARLDAGGKVLFCAEKGAIRLEKGGRVALGFSSIFWNTAWTGRQPPHTLGILCDPKHPALAEFPTEFHSNWQWWDAMTHGQAMILDDFGPALTPIIRVIDDWVTNRSLGLVFECRVGKGKLLVSSIDLFTGAEARPEARQLLTSLKKYMAGPAFDPKFEADPVKLRGLFIAAAAK